MLGGYRQPLTSTHRQVGGVEGLLRRPPQEGQQGLEGCVGGRKDGGVEVGVVQRLIQASSLRRGRARAAVRLLAVLQELQSGW